jgi:membrane-bound lytic murein transglycosylase D
MNKLYNISVFIFLLNCFTNFSGFSQNKPTDEITDDPIVAALDSLYKLDLFEKGYQKTNAQANSKYNFSPDSVPRYDATVYASRLAKLDAQSPFNLQYNEIVRGYIEMYAMRKRTVVSRMMALSQYYFPMFEEALDKYNLPLELKYLAICESALNPIARSRAGAAGLWQFMYPTGKMFGLKVNSYIDERYDPLKSTNAACEYFQYLYSLYNNWELVLAAYNCGPGNVNRAIRKSGGKRTYWEVRPFLPRETRGYVPAFIAVNYVMNHATDHNIQSATPKQYFYKVDTVVVKKQLSFYQLSSLLKVSEEELQFLNPCYRKRVIPVIVGYTSILTLPSDKMGIFINNEDKIYDNIKDTPPPVIVEDPQRKMKIHVVKKNETMVTIARKYGCTSGDIKRWNRRKSSTVRVGERLKVYVKIKTPNPAVEKALATNKEAELPPSTVAQKKETGTVITSEADNNSAKEEASKPVSPATEEAAASTTKGNFKYHTIKKGDSLYKIALKYNTTIDNIKRLNHLGVNYNLLPGKQLKVGTL